MQTHKNLNVTINESPAQSVEQTVKEPQDNMSGQKISSTQINSESFNYSPLQQKYGSASKKSEPTLLIQSQNLEEKNSSLLFSENQMQPPVSGNQRKMNKDAQPETFYENSNIETQFKEAQTIQVKVPSLDKIELKEVKDEIQKNDQSLISEPISEIIEETSPGQLSILVEKDSVRNKNQNQNENSVIRFEIRETENSFDVPLSETGMLQQSQKSDIDQQDEKIQNLEISSNFSVQNQPSCTSKKLLEQDIFERNQQFDSSIKTEEKENFQVSDQQDQEQVSTKLDKQVALTQDCHEININGITVDFQLLKNSEVQSLKQINKEQQATLMSLEMTNALLEVELNELRAVNTNLKAENLSLLSSQQDLQVQNQQLYHELQNQVEVNKNLTYQFQEYLAEQSKSHQQKYQQIASKANQFIQSFKISNQGFKQEIIKLLKVTYQSNCQSNADLRVLMAQFEATTLHKQNLLIDQLSQTEQRLDFLQNEHIALKQQELKMKQKLDRLTDDKEDLIQKINEKRCENELMETKLQSAIDSQVSLREKLQQTRPSQKTVKELVPAKDQDNFWVIVVCTFVACMLMQRFLL